ncbi:MAG: [Cardiobacteriaceae bacterium]|nr:[protein-PII] uridylyltransferase [Cardiobacteriaceae bacterium]
MNIQTDLLFPEIASLQENATDKASLLRLAKIYFSELKNAQFKAVEDAQSRSFNADLWLTHHCRQIDFLLAYLFQNNGINLANCVLLAVGGYGRGELFPRSDIDFCVLCRDQRALYQEKEAISKFLYDAWQLNLNISPSIRSLDTIYEEAKADFDLLTSLVEARALAGEREIKDQLDFKNPSLPSPKEFLQAKIKEQLARDEKQNRVGSLEPDIKNDPGTLRDIQMINWIYRYCLHPKEHLWNLQGLLTARENRALAHSAKILRQIRFILHLLPQAQKDRLTFEAQKKIAEFLGFRDGKNNLAVERFMRRFYLSTLRARRLNRLAIKLIEARICEEQVVEMLDQNFIISNQRLAIKKPAILFKQPELIWKIFLHLLNRPDIDSVSAQLARQLRALPEHFFQQKSSHKAEIDRLFLQIFNHPGDIARQLRRMHRYGLLGRYIPAFRGIIGRMQYDLFHEYTVDQHSLRLAFFFDYFKRPCPEYPQAEEIMTRLANPALLYIAGIFHDIGKGRGTDHSIAGAKIVREFARQNLALKPKEQNLLEFLVREHLLLSDTAQKQDISNLQVIGDFVRKIPDREYLDYLYLLTLADISATNSKLWNSWRAQLLNNLYRQASDLLKPPGHSLRNISTLKQQALLQIPQDLYLEVEKLWQQLPNNFFSDEKQENIIKKTLFLLDKSYQVCKLTLLESKPAKIFAFSDKYSSTAFFSQITHYLEKNNLNITEARIHQIRDKSAIRTIQEYSLLLENPPEQALLAEIELKIKQENNELIFPKIIDNKTKHFNRDCKVNISNNYGENNSLLGVFCPDKKGLLSLISRVFLQEELELKTAKIATYGEKVEDYFYVRKNNLPLDKKEAEKISEKLQNILTAYIQNYD